MKKIEWKSFEGKYEFKKIKARLSRRSLMCCGLSCRGESAGIARLQEPQS
jgi:hypothetical protein